MHSGGTDGGYQCILIVGDLDQIMAAALAVLDEGGLGKELLTADRGEKGELAHRRHGRNAAVVGRHRKGEVGQREQHAAHHLPHRIAVVGTNRQTALGIMGAAVLDENTGHFGGIAVTGKKRPPLVGRHKVQFAFVDQSQFSVFSSSATVSVVIPFGI